MHPLEGSDSSELTVESSELRIKQAVHSPRLSQIRESRTWVLVLMLRVRVSLATMYSGVPDHRDGSLQFLSLTSGPVTISGYELPVRVYGFVNSRAFDHGTCMQAKHLIHCRALRQGGYVQVIQVAVSAFARIMENHPFVPGSDMSPE